MDMSTDVVSKNFVVSSERKVRQRNIQNIELSPKFQWKKTLNTTCVKGMKRVWTIHIPAIIVS